MAKQSNINAKMTKRFEREPKPPETGLLDAVTTPDYGGRKETAFITPSSLIVSEADQMARARENRRDRAIRPLLP